MNKQPTTLVSTMTSKELKNVLNDIQTVTSLALLFHTRNGDLQTITSHEVDAGNDGPQIMPGTPLSPEDELRVMSLLQRPETPAVQSFLPASVLYTDRLRTLWWTPSQVRPMHLKNGNDKPITVQAHWPAMAMLAQNQRLFLVGLPSDERPSIETPIYHCPLANIWASQEMCVGSAKLPDGCSPSDIPGWEDVVFATAFTHSNHDSVIRTSSRDKAAAIDPMDYWAKPKKKVLTPGQLFPLHTSLGQWAFTLESSQ